MDLEEKSEENIKMEAKEDTNIEGEKLELLITKEEDKKLGYLTEYLYKGGLIEENNKTYTARYAILFLYNSIKNYIKERRKRGEK